MDCEASKSNEFVETRVVDRSGDIDQRPLEERGAVKTASAVTNAAPTEMPQASMSLAVTQDSGKSVSPPVNQADLADAVSLVTRHQKDLDVAAGRAKTKLKAHLSEIEKQETRCVAPDLDADLQHIRFQRHKILIGSGPLLADSLRDEQARLGDLDTFKIENGLVREAHYPASPILALGVLFMLIVVEAGLNGVLFAEGSDRGLFGGWLEAIVLSITNVGAAFLLGRLVLPHLNQRNLLARGTAGSLTLFGAILLVTLNLLAAHYRDYKTQTAVQTPTVAAVQPASVPLKTALKQPLKDASGQATSAKPQPSAPLAAEASAEFQALKRTFDDPLAMQSFTSVFLLVIGLCAAVVAVWDGYKLDDPYPGYGRRHRLYASLRVKRMQIVTRILTQANGILSTSFLQVSQKVDGYDRSIERLQQAHRAYTSEWQSLSDALQAAASQSEAEVSAHCRLVHKRASLAPVSVETLAQEHLPTLPIKHAKVLEQHQKKYASLRKLITKEQASLVELFERSACDFEALLAQLSQVDFLKTAAQPSLPPTTQKATTQKATTQEAAA